MRNVPMRRGNPLSRLRRDFDDLMHRWRGGASHELEPTETNEPMAIATMGWPAIDMRETDDEIQVRAEMPGLDKDDFRVEVDRDRLLISGEKRSERQETREGYEYRESSYGSFSRVVPLPCDVDETKTAATYKNGVLSVKMPKTETAKRRQVEVNVG